MKKYAYTIFWPFYHTWNLLNSHQNGDFPLGHPSSKCSRPSTLNFQVLFVWVTPTLVIAYWYYYPFNLYKPYVCECRSVCRSVCMWVSMCVCVLVWVCEYVCVHVWVSMWVCMGGVYMCEYVSMWVCECEYVCVSMCMCMRKNLKNLIKILKKSKNLKI
jgi:hypothetical protein